MVNTDTLRRDFDEFLQAHGANMTNKEVIEKALETERLLFTYANNELKLTA